MTDTLKAFDETFELPTGMEVDRTRAWKLPGGPLALFDPGARLGAVRLGAELKWMMTYPVENIREFVAFVNALVDDGIDPDPAISIAPQKLNA